MQEEEFEKLLKKGNEILPHPISIEVGQDLFYLFNDNKKDSFIEKANKLRDSLIEEWGVNLPLFQILINKNLEPCLYRFLLYNREILRRRVQPGKTLVITDKEKLFSISGDIKSDPIFSQPCIWIEPNKSNFSYLTKPYIASVEEVILDHFEAVLRSNVKKLVTSDIIEKKLQYTYRRDPKVLKEALKKISIGNLTRVIKNLVSEGLPLTEINRVLITISKINFTKEDPDSIAELVRNFLKDDIHQHIFRNQTLIFTIVDPYIQLWLYNHWNSKESFSSKDPVAQYLLKELTNLYLSFHCQGFRIGIICCASVRLIIRKIIEKRLPNLIVLKPDEIYDNQGLNIIKTIKTNSFKVKVFWFWFWLTSSEYKKKLLKSDLKIFSEFINLHVDNKHNNNLTKNNINLQISHKKNSPSKLNFVNFKNLSGIQKISSILLSCSDNHLKNIFSGLNRNELNLILEEMNSLPLSSEDIKKFIDKDNILLNPNQATTIINIIKKSLTIEPSILSLTPLQKLAIFLSSLKPEDAEKIYSLILSEMSSQQLESLTYSNKLNQNPIPINKARNKIIEDFMWYKKGNQSAFPIYSKTHWKTNLQSIALRYPKSIAKAIGEIWLCENILVKKFCKMIKKYPLTSSCWIRRYITSKRNVNIKISRIEKTYILLHLLPQELRENIIIHFNTKWKRIFNNIPFYLEKATPEETGIVLSQFLSFYYGSRGKNFISKTSLN